MITSTANLLEALAIDGDYRVTAWLDVDGLPDEQPVRLVVEMHRRGEAWSVLTMPYSDGDEYGPDGIGEPLARVEGQDGPDPLRRLVMLLTGRATGAARLRVVN
jgi:hypothetical protein